MTPIRAKDKLFLAVAVPVAIVAAYVWLYRADASKRLDALRGETAALVEPAMFEMEMRAARAMLADAEREFEAEMKRPPELSRVKGGPGDSQAMRERAVLEIFRDCGIGVMRSDDAPRGTFAADAHEAEPLADAGKALSGCGARPSPVRRRYVLDGAYPAVRNALGAFAAREMAVVPCSVEMRENGRGRWTLLLWL